MHSGALLLVKINKITPREAYLGPSKVIEARVQSQPGIPRGLAVPVVQVTAVVHKPN